jgi:queuine tRNA-ribosyltransferase
LGVDQFDCVLQTRLGRHGTALTSQGRVNLKRSEFTLNSDPIDSTCSCSVCARHTRGYIRHLFQVGEPTASRLVSIHNIAWTLSLMDQMRNAIIAGRFEALRQEILAVWGTAA